MKKILHIIAIAVAAVAALTGLNSCIEDGFTTSEADQPVFAVDTLDLGEVFTEEPTMVHRFVVYNRAKKSISISRIAVSGENAGLFRLNVDGFGAEEFHDVEIRGEDSIFVFVDANLPSNGTMEPVKVTASLDFTTNGVTRSVVLAATGVDAHRLQAEVLTEDTHFVADRPYIVYDSLVVSPDCRLTLDAGVKLCFHDGAYMAVRGTLEADGTVEQPVTLCGDRMGNVAADIPYDLMSNQWLGLFFTHTSHDSRLTNTVVKNTIQGVTIDGEATEAGEAPMVTLLNCRLRNSGTYALLSFHGGVKAVGCEFAEAGAGVVYLEGGSHTFNHCTFANYYLFTAIGGPILQFAHLSATLDDDGTGLPYTRADFTNSIIYCLGSDISHGDLEGTAVTFSRCLFKSEGTDDANFINCLWGADPLYYTVREDYYFDYRLMPDSPAIGAADPALTLPEAATDGYGLARGAAPDLGAYVYQPQAQQ